MAPDDDAVLVERCRAGDAEAFGTLVERYQRRVIGLCYRHVHDYQEACDLAQDVFVQAFQALPSFRGTSRFSTWLYRVALNASYNRQRYFRSKGRNTVTSFEGLVERRGGSPDAVPGLGSREPGALDRLVADEEAALLRGSVAALAKDYRAVVDLVDIEGLSYADAADVLGVPVNTVRSRLNRARTQLKETLVRRRARRTRTEKP